MKENNLVIKSISNEKIKYFLSLKDKKIRNVEKKFLIEGLHLVEEASKTSDLETIITSDEALLNKFKGLSKILVTDQIIEKLSTTKTPQKVLGVVKMKEYSNDDLEKIISKNDVKIILLDEVNDPGNLGTIIRTSSALGYSLIIMSNNTVDLYNEKVLRATQGVIFKIPIIKMNLSDAIINIKNHQIKCYGTSLDKTSKFIEDVKKEARFAICFGNEARGISKDILDLMDEKIKIEMKNDVESLNVAISAAIIMYEWMK